MFQKAVESRPKEAMDVLREEVIKAVKIDVWDVVHLKNMTHEERELIILQMMNYLEKYNPGLTFDKCKIRVLTRGGNQLFTGGTEGPVTRVGSLLMLLGIAIHEDLVVFKVNLGSVLM